MLDVILTSNSFQDVDASGFSIQQHKVLLELILEVQPVEEAEAAGLHF